MAKITTINEPWDGHNYPEVEEFIKTQLKKYDEEADDILFTEHPEVMPLTFEAAESVANVYFKQLSLIQEHGIEPLKIEVSVDKGRTWEEFTATTDGGTKIATIKRGEKVFIRGNNEAYGCFIRGEGYIGNCGFFADSSCYVYGNIMSLIDKNNFAKLQEVKEGAFTHLFSEYEAEDSFPWVLSKEGKELLLPATTIADSCYQSMFYRCTGLTFAPKLPATTMKYNCYRSMFDMCTNLILAPELPATNLAESCYDSMFSGCTNLTNVPNLPAETLADYCYYHMFSDCKTITTAPELPATILANYCYGSMFNGCTSLNATPDLPATTLAESCYYEMFYGCTSLVNAPALPATTLAEGCYRSMFDGCASLVTAPSLPATTLKSGCYSYMFRGCSSLKYVKAMFTTTPTSDYTNTWLNGVSATGTFVKNAAATWDVIGTYGIPEGWTVETASE